MGESLEAWSCLQYGAILAWLAVLSLLWRHLTSSSEGKGKGKQLPKLDEKADQPPSRPPSILKAASRVVPPEAAKVVAKKPAAKAEEATPWTANFFGCCAQRPSTGVNTDSKGKRRTKGAWQRDEVAKAGVPVEAVDDVTKLAAVLGLGTTEPLCDPLTLFRYYRSREGDVEAAAAMYRTSLVWRTRFSIKDVMSAQGMGENYLANGGRQTEDHGTWQWERRDDTLEGKFVKRHGFFGRLKLPAPEDGSPIGIWRPAAADFEGFAREGLTQLCERGFVAHLEDLLQSSRAASHRQGKLVRCRLVIDAQGMSMPLLLKRRKTVKAFLDLGKTYFPEVNASVSIVRAPTVMAQIWAFVQPLLTPVMRAKVCILGENFEDGLKEHSGLPMSSLPVYLGGEAPDDEICLALPVPTNAASALKKGGAARK